MVLPYYVSPDQMMADKAEYAKKGIGKGRSIIAVEYEHGILLVADNPSMSLHKISEIYDNIAFAGAGKYSEFENLRKAGIRHADLKGYVYSREDVTAMALANAYSETLGAVFGQEIKPLEIEILVVGVKDDSPVNEMYRISFDGSIIDEKGAVVIGGRSDAIRMKLKDKYRGPASLEEALRICASVFEDAGNPPLTASGLEAAVMDRQRRGRKFRRLEEAEVERYLAGK